MGSVSQEGNVNNVNNRGTGDSTEVSPVHRFEVGDMVWGKVKSHPWWPGHVYSEELATPSVRRSKRDGLLLVAFFGDSIYGWFDPSELIPFDSNFSEKSVQTKSRTFVKALKEAIDEATRRTALGLSCMCRNKQNFRQTDAQGFYAVDVVGYDPGALYSIDTIVKARESFQTKSVIDFVRELALEPTEEHDDIDFIMNKATVMSYRRAVYEEIDETYDLAFGGDLVRPLPGSLQVSTRGKKTAKAPLSGRQVFGDTVKSPNKPPNKKDKYILKRRDETKIHQIEEVKESSSSSSPTHPLSFEDPTIATLKASTLKDANIVPESNSSDFDINTPISSLFHKRPAGEVCSGKSVSPEKKTKRNKVAGEVTSGNSENKKKRKMANGEMELPSIVENLHLFALSPSFSNDRKLQSNVQKVILKFRSLVFQKTLNEANDTHTKSLVVKKPQVRPLDDPTKGGIMREQITTKKKMKIDEDRGRKSGQEVGQRRAEEPTTLKMEFPTGGSLPSISELKAKWGRFGKLDHDGTRIYWKTFTCLVVYKYKADAEVALKAVETSSNLFGTTDVKYSLKEVSDSQPPAKVSDHQPKVENRAAGLPVKSCLKKSGSEKKSRVRFNLIEDASQSNKSSRSKPPPLPPPLASPPPPPPWRPMRYSTTPWDPPSLPPRPMVVPPPPNIDIAQQMLSLLTRCNDVVAHVTSILGYVPYHTL